MHGWQAYDEVAARLRAHAWLACGRTGILGPRDIVAVMSVRSDKFLRLPARRATAAARRGVPGGAGPSGCASRSWRRCPRALPAGRRAPGDLPQGHALMYRDPMLRAERSIHRALDEAMFMSLRQRTRDEDRRAQGLDEIIGRAAGA